MRSWTPRREAAAVPVRFFVSPEGDTSFGETTIALSPDGRELAFAATGAGGKAGLWVRRLEALAARPVPGTEAGRYPFWSPDGRSLAFFAGGKLLKVALSGGPPQPLADAPDGRGGTWSREGVIVFAPNGRSGLWRVSAEGGTPAPLTRLDAGTKERTHRWPSFLPNGRRFVYTSDAPGEDARGVYLASLDGEPPRRLTGAVSSACVAGARLLFVRRGALLAQALDAEGGRLTGDPVAVAEELWSDFTSTNGLAGFAAAGGTLAYRTGGSAARARLAWLDRTGRETGAAGGEADYFGLALSSDGKRFAAGESDGEGFLDLWVVEPETSRVSRLTSNPSDDSQGVWSPDGRRMAFGSSRDGVDQIYERSTDGVGEETRLLRTEAPSFPDSWSPDGRFLLYTAIDPESKYDLWTLPLGGGAPTPFRRTRFSEGSAQFSPDGRFVAYESDESGRNEVYVETFPPSAARWTISTGGGGGPLWRGDGRELYYLSAEGWLTAVEIRPGPHGIEAGAPRALFRPSLVSTPFFAPNYAVSPDGQRFLVAVPASASGRAPIAVATGWDGSPPR